MCPPGAASISRPTRAPRGALPASTTRTDRRRAHPSDEPEHRVAANGNAFTKRRARGFKTRTAARREEDAVRGDSVGAADVELNPANPTSSTHGCGAASASRTIISGGGRGERQLLQEHRRRRTLDEDHQRLPTGFVGRHPRPRPRIRIVYALVERSPRRALSPGRSGPPWSSKNSTPGMIARPFHHHARRRSDERDIVYGGAETFYKSTDGGRR